MQKIRLHVNEITVESRRKKEKTKYRKMDASIGITINKYNDNGNIMICLSHLQKFDWFDFQRLEIWEVFVNNTKYLKIKKKTIKLRQK